MVAAAVVGGAALAAWHGHALIASHPVHHPPAGTSFFIGVIEANARVWLFICTGLASFGVAGCVVLLANAFRFGMDLVSAARGTPHELAYLLPHAALEFGAFTLAAASCQYLAWYVFELLVLRRSRVPPGPGIQALALSLVVLVAAACVEAYAFSVRTGL